MKIISTCRAPSFGHSAAHTAPPLGGQYATPLSQGKMFFHILETFSFYLSGEDAFQRVHSFHSSLIWNTSFNISHLLRTCRDSIFLELIYSPINVCSTLSMAVKSVSKKREGTSNIFHPENMIWPHTSLQNQTLYIQISWHRRLIVLVGSARFGGLLIKHCRKISENSSLSWNLWDW